MKIGGLVKKALFGTAVVASTFLPSKLNAQYPGVLNRLTRPNEVVDKYGSYGSGDVDQDGDVDWDDNVAMDTIKNFYSDVDGDGDQSTAKDKKHHADYLNGLISYLQGDYDALQTSEERKDWISKIYPIMTELNNYEFIPSNDPRSENVDTRFDSDNGGLGDCLTGNGYNPSRDDFNEIHEKYNLNYNGLFNLPFCDVTVTTDAGFAHTLSGLFTGDSVKNLEDLIFLEPQEGRVVEPGQD